MNDTFLAVTEIAQLTGAKRARKQIAWLDREGWCYVLDCKGQPKVAREFFKPRLGVKHLAGESFETSGLPNWSSWSDQ